MDEKELKKFEALAQMREFWWGSFDRRRSYEWKICLAIWTAFLAFSALMLRAGPSLPTTCPIKVAAVILIITIVVVLHSKWIWMMGGANHLDKRQAFTYDREMKELTKVQYDDALEADVKNREKAGRTKWWVQRFQTAITLGLGLLAVLALCGATE